MLWPLGDVKEPLMSILDYTRLESIDEGQPKTILLSLGELTKLIAADIGVAPEAVDLRFVERTVLGRYSQHLYVEVSEKPDAADTAPNGTD